MKKVLVLLLSLCLLISAFGAYAEQSELEAGVEYEGVWFPITGIGLQIYMPYDWAVFDYDDAYLMVGDENGDQIMWIVLIENTDGYTNDAIFNEISTSPVYQNVYELNFTDVRLTCFEVEDEETEGIFANALSADGAYVCFFGFTPNSLLAQQMLSTISYYSENANETASW